MSNQLKPSTRPGRVFAISDLHVDYPANLEWVEAISAQAHREDALIVAGDVTHDLGLLERTLGALADRFAAVGFVPGNHELWLRGGGADNSLEKFNQIERLCKQLKVHSEPFRFGASATNTTVSGVWIVPLHSWYARPEDSPDSLFMEKPGESGHLRGWSDSHFVRWPDSMSPAAHEYFVALNEPWVDRFNTDKVSAGDNHAAENINGNTTSGSVISFSHFLPRADLMRATMEERRMMSPNAVDPAPKFNFSRVAGSAAIERQIRRLMPAVHVYGHQHRNRQRDVDGVTYLSNCLGYPHRERAQVGNAEPALALVHTLVD